MRESELFQILKNGLNSLGLDVYGEVSLSFGKAIDCVAVKNGHIIGIELKKTNSKKLIRQGLRTRRYCHYTFVATSAKPGTKFLEKLKQYGIGFIYIKYTGKTAIEVLLRPSLFEPKKYLILHPYCKKQLGGVSSFNFGGPSRRTIFQQLTLDIEAYLQARKGKAVHWKVLKEWMETYCVGIIPKHRIINVLNISTNIITYNGYAMYFKNHQFRLLPGEREYLIKETIKKNWDK